MSPFPPLIKKSLFTRCSVLRVKHIFYAWLGLVLLLLLLVPFSGAAEISAELEQKLVDSAPEIELPIIIKFIDNAPLALSKNTKNKKESRANFIRALRKRSDSALLQIKGLLEKNKIKKKRVFWNINAMAITATPTLIRQLAQHPAVKKIQYDRPLKAADMLLEAEPNIGIIRAPELWSSEYRGQGMVVASLDSGVDYFHPDLKNRWRGGSSSWFDPYGEHDFPEDSAGDLKGHGTRVMGIMVGGNAGGTDIGVASGAKWIAAKIFNDAGQSTISLIHESFQWLLDPDGDPDTDDGPDVVNNSWGFPDLFGECDGVDGYEDEYRPDIQALKNAGIGVVFSAGNKGPSVGTSIPPANNPEAFSVGAVDTLYYPIIAIDSLSSRGPGCNGAVYPDLVAPGVGIYSSYLTFGGSVPDSYASSAGTSFSAPHVTGAMALLLSAFPDLSVQAMEDALRQSGTDNVHFDDPTGPDNSYGYGLLDTVQAYNELSNNPGLTPCVRPVIDFNASPNPAAVNTQTTFSSIVSGGVPPYTYSWDVNGDGLENCATESCDYTYSAPYYGTVSLTVTDSQGCSSELYRAGGWAWPLAVSINADNNPVLTGDTVTFTADSVIILPTGTLPSMPYFFSWDVDGDGNADCEGYEFNALHTPVFGGLEDEITVSGQCMHTYDAGYDGDATVTVIDNRGGQVVSTLAVEVVQEIPAGSGGGGGGGCFIAVLKAQ